MNTPANPAKLGTIVSIYATGTGDLNPALPDGEIAPLPPAYFLTVNPPAVTFAGVRNGHVGGGGARIDCGRDAGERAVAGEPARGYESGGGTGGVDRAAGVLGGRADQRGELRFAAVR